MGIVDRDIAEAGVTVRKPATLLDWLRAYAAATATTTAYSRILDAATPGKSDKPAKTTVIGYRDLLRASDASLLAGTGRRLGAGHTTLLGSLFESLATLCVRVAAQSAEADLAHLRTRNGDHEVDLIVIGDDGKVVALEVKLGSVVDDRDVRHLHWLADQIGSDLLDAVVLTTGPVAYRRPDGVAVVPLALLGP